MLRKICRWVFLPVFVFCAYNLHAGDIAAFIDFGFSENGKFYAFAQYGVEASTLIPWAELFIVDVAANDFVKDGIIKYKHNKEIEAGQDGSGAIFSLLSRNTALAAKYGFDFLRQGVPLFISLENGQYKADSAIEFRDFDYNISYKAALNPEIRSSGKNLTSSFTIDLERSDGSAVSNYKIGTPEMRRALITSYTIKRVFASPDRKSMVFVLEMTRTGSDNEAPDIRYMVETIRF
ncbi:MAG: DUF2259 domain-containing protein [Spirochaetaceae bacterium]|jgi:predicted secreted protein|nr:DUF2259 domain-containing protein [Spirochaetaceae bacterium]